MPYTALGFAEDAWKKKKKYSPKSGFHGDLSWCKVQNQLNKQIRVYNMPT